MLLVWCHQETLMVVPLWRGLNKISEVKYREDKKYKQKFLGVRRRTYLLHHGSSPCTGLELETRRIAPAIVKKIKHWKSKFKPLWHNSVNIFLFLAHRVKQRINPSFFIINPRKGWSKKCINSDKRGQSWWTPEVEAKDSCYNSKLHQIHKLILLDSPNHRSGVAHLKPLDIKYLNKP